MNERREIISMLRELSQAAGLAWGGIVSYEQLRFLSSGGDEPRTPGATKESKKEKAGAARGPLRQGTGGGGSACLREEVQRLLDTIYLESTFLRQGWKQLGQLYELGLPMVGIVFRRGGLLL